MEDVLRKLGAVEGLSRNDLVLAGVLMRLELTDPEHVLEAARAAAGRPPVPDGLSPLLAALVNAGHLDVEKAREVESVCRQKLAEAAAGSSVLTRGRPATRDVRPGADVQPEAKPSAPEAASPYASPEQTRSGRPGRPDARGRSARDVGPETDVWALGVTLFEFLTGRPPWTAREIREFGGKGTRPPPADLRRQRPDLPEELANVVTRALSPRPADRYSDCAEMAEDLGKYLGSLSEGAGSLADDRAGSARTALTSVAPPPPKIVESIGRTVRESRPASPGGPAGEGDGGSWLSVRGLKGPRGLVAAALVLAAGAAVAGYMFRWGEDAPRSLPAPGPESQTTVTGGALDGTTSLRAGDASAGGAPGTRSVEPPQAAPEVRGGARSAAEADGALPKDQEEAARESGEEGRAAVYGKWMEDGRFLRLKGDYAEAAEAYAKASTHAPPGSTEARDMAVECLFRDLRDRASKAERSGDFELAADLYRAALEKKEDAGVRTRLAAAAEKLEEKRSEERRRAEAARMVEEAEAAERQGWAKVALRSYRRAAELGAEVTGRIALLEKQVGYDEAMARAHVRVRTESWEEAASILQEILRERPGDGAATSLLTQVRKRLGPPEELSVDLGDGVTQELVYVAPGRFAMGFAAGYANERPVHEVTLTKGFYIGRREVTRREFAAFVRATEYWTEAEREGWAYAWAGSSWGRVNGISWKDPGFEQTDDHPVVCVSWNDADAFCEWVSTRSGRECRLPTEAEWEYACRSGTETAYQWGKDPNGGSAWCNAADVAARARYPTMEVFNWSDGYVFTAPVARLEPTAWGLFDLLGNAREWCSDFYEGVYYNRSPSEDPRGPEVTRQHVNRGGSWVDGPDDCRSSSRAGHEPSKRYNNLGFRAAVSVPADR